MKRKLDMFARGFTFWFIVSILIGLLCSALAQAGDGCFHPFSGPGCYYKTPQCRKIVEKKPTLTSKRISSRQRQQLYELRNDVYDALLDGEKPQYIWRGLTQKYRIPKKMRNQFRMLTYKMILSIQKEKGV